MGVYQAIKEEKAYPQGQLKLTHTSFAILNSYVKVIYLLKVYQKHLFLGGSKHKMWKQLCGFFQTKVTIK